MSRIDVVVSICRKLNQGIGKKDGASDRNGHRHQVFGHAARCEPVPCLVDQPADGGHEGFVRFEHFVPYYVEWIGEGGSGNTRCSALCRRSNQSIAIVRG